LITVFYGIVDYDGIVDGVVRCLLLLTPTICVVVVVVVGDFTFSGTIIDGDDLIC
jgi:hypothetical protein